ncbi:MAG: mandelate racemase/muconate lactonizing enzyme family protein [Candidatus Nanopelagicales bacterium]|nr:mandelate racemase/muconate lactonizing enzyme family protein [Candidatus Nanopelagicales bacterium]
MAASAQSVPDLRIERIETIPVRVPLDRVYKGSHYKMTHRSTIITRVYTASGIVGEAYAGDEDAGLGEIDGIIHKEIAPKLIGEDAFAIERCWGLARPATWDILRDRRLGLVATACIDVALWDAVGRALGMPLWKLWGGYRNSVPVITIGGYYAKDADITAEVRGLVEAQFAGMKFKVGGLSPEEDAVRLREARRAAGDDFALAVDANQGWTPAQAIRFAQLVEDCNLLWFEEPCQWQNDRRAMRDVRLGGGVPVCAGQSEFSAAGCRDLMETGSVDFCNFDSSWSGGPTEWRRVAGMATVYDVRMAHHEEAHVAAHLLASIPHGTYLEYFHPQRDPIWHNLIANRPALKDGRITLTDRPGLGWDLDEDYIAKYRISFD